MSKIEVTRREFLEVIGLGAVSLTLPNWPKSIERQGEPQNGYEIKKIKITEGDALSLVEKQTPRSSSPIIKDIKLEENLNGIFVPDIEFESPAMQEKLELVVEKVNTLRSQGIDADIKAMFDWESMDSLPIGANLAIVVNQDAAPLRSGGYIFIDENFDYHPLNPSDKVENTSVRVIKLDQETNDQIERVVQSRGYGNIEMPGEGAWIPVVLDAQGNISDIMVQDAAIGLTKLAIVQEGDLRLNVRTEPDDSKNDNIITSTLDVYTSIVSPATPTSPPPALPGGVSPESVYLSEYHGEPVYMTNANGYEWTLMMHEEGGDVKYAWAAINLKNPEVKYVAAGPKVKDELIFKTLEEINYIDAVENPHEAYGITEEEYLDTKDTVLNLIPTEFRDQVLEQADGYSHEHRAFVKKDKETGEISYWRPGMGHELEDGWVQVLDKVQLPESLGGGLLYLEGNKKQLQERENYNMDDLSHARLNFDLFDDLTEKLTRNLRFAARENPIFIQIGAFNDTDVYKPTADGSMVFTGYKLEVNKSFYQGRILYTLTKQWGIETAKSALSENLILVLIGVYFNERGDFIRNSSRTSRLPVVVDGIMNTVLGEDHQTSYVRTAEDLVRERFIVTLP